MKLSIWSALTVLLTTVPCLSQTSPDVLSSMNAGYSLTIAPPTDQIRLGTTINITITVKNTSDSDIYWRAELGNTAYHAFRFLLIKDGKEVESTRFHRMIRNEPRPDDQTESAVGSGSSVVSALEPGKSFTLTIDLNKLYEIKQPGQYTITASRTEETKDGKFVVKSNAVTLDIVP